MKYFTIYSINGDIIKKEFETEEQRDQHTGNLWDTEVMDKVDWIDYDDEGYIESRDCFHFAIDAEFVYDDGAIRALTKDEEDKLWRIVEEGL